MYFVKILNFEITTLNGFYELRLENRDVYPNFIKFILFMLIN